MCKAVFFKKLKYRRDVLGDVIVNKHKCLYCGTCVAVCPMDAIELIDKWVEINEDCNDCSVCAKICPVGALGGVK
ncbi:indolepyruvate ferredoxin oxidoreductase subunit alpha [Halobacteriota archaeon]